jgi:hypothetical protein
MEDVLIENQELNLISKELKIYKLPEKSSSEYDNLTAKEKILFLAGVFDGEGSFGIWSKFKTKKYFACSVEMTDKDMVKRFHEFYGGCIYLCKRRKPHHQDTWRWRINGQGALNSIDKMIDYLSIRRKEKFKNVVQCLKTRIKRS